MTTGPSDKKEFVVEEFVEAGSEKQKGFEEDLTGLLSDQPGQAIDDLSGLVSERQDAYTDDLTALSSEPSAGFEDLTGISIGDRQIDESLFEDVLAIQDVVPTPESDLALFAEPVLLCVRGREYEAALAKPFSPLQSALALRSSEEFPQSTMDFVGLDYIGLIGRPEQFPDSGKKSYMEIIETLGGKTLEVDVIATQDMASGIFGQSSTISERYKYFFFPKSSIRFRYQTRPVGEILVDKGFVTKPVIEEALARQKKMRAVRIGAILAKLAGIEIGIIDNALRKAWGENPDDKTLTGEILTNAGIVSRVQVEEALKIQKKMRAKKIGELLIEMNQATEEQVYRALAIKFRKPFIDLGNVPPASETAFSLLPRELVLKLQVYPLAVQDDCLIVATSRPELPAISDIIRKQLQYQFQLVVVTPSLLRSAIARKYSN